MKNDDRGSLLIMTFFIVIALATILTAASLIFVGGKRGGRAFGGTQAVGTNVASLQAHYIAEMGIEKALSNPFVLQSTLLYGTDTIRSQTPIALESGKRGTYETTMSKQTGDVIELVSRGEVKNQNDVVLLTKTITCRFQLKSGSFYDVLLKNAIATSQDLNSGKVYVHIDTDANGNPVAQYADVYSDANITNIAGTIPGSVFAQGQVIVNNKATIVKDVIAKGTITLNNNVKVGDEEGDKRGKVISAESYVDVNNNAKVYGDIVAYGTDANGYSVYLTNSSVQNIYTKLGSSQVKSKNSSYNSIGTIPKLPDYPGSYEVPRQTLPTIDEEIKAIWVEQAKSDNIIYNNDLNVGNGQEFTIEGNAFIGGNLVLNNNATLRVKEGSIIYVAGRIDIENNASITVLDADNNQEVKKASLITESYFYIRNNAVPNVLSLVALGSSTSYLKNNSVTTGAILVPNGSLEISNRATIYGGIFAKSIPNIGNNAKVYFNPWNNLSLPPTVTSSKALDLLAWTE